MSVDAKKMIIGVLLLIPLMLYASKLLSKDIVTVAPDAGQFFFEELQDIPRMTSPVTSANGIPPCKMSPAEGEAAQQIEAVGWAILSEVMLKFRLVTFAGKLTQEQSGMCRISSSYLGVFKGRNLLVLSALQTSKTHT